jgi:hypothetical protein
MQMASSIIQENSQMKKDLDFANAEIERLRSKFVDTEDQLFDSHGMTTSSKNIDSLDSCNNNNTSGEIY